MISSGPNLHTGPIGEKLLTVTNELIRSNFTVLTIDDEFRETLRQSSDLSSDQKYLRDIVVINSNDWYNTS